jgi:uncharacterized membrane protein (DUF2068 family)
VSLELLQLLAEHRAEHAHLSRIGSWAVCDAHAVRTGGTAAEVRDPARSRRIIRLIAAERFLRGLLLLGAGAYLLTHVGSDFSRLADHLMRRLELDPRRPFLRHILAKLHRLRASTVVITGIAALGYGLLELVEGVGLWLDQLWAEYLTVIATSVLIPFEIYELVRKPSMLKATGIAVNAAIVAYLAYALQRRLAHERRNRV